MRKEQWTGLLYLAPVLFLIIAFFLYPSISIIRTSFYTTKYGINFDFAGLKNYRIIFQDEVFRASLINSLKWTVSGMLLPGSPPSALLAYDRWCPTSVYLAASSILWSKS